MELNCEQPSFAPKGRDPITNAPVYETFKDRSLNREEILFVLDQVKTKQFTQLQFQEHNNISSQRISNWKKRKLDPNHSLTGKNGRDSIFDTQAKDEIKTLIVDRQSNVDPVAKKQRSISHSEYTRLIIAKSIETDKRRGKTSSSHDPLFANVSKNQQQEGSKRS